MFLCIRGVESCHRGLGTKSYENMCRLYVETTTRSCACFQILPKFNARALNNLIQRIQIEEYKVEQISQQKNAH